MSGAPKVGGEGVRRQVAVQPQGSEIRPEIGGTKKDSTSSNQTPNYRDSSGRLSKRLGEIRPNLGGGLFGQPIATIQELRQSAARSDYFTFEVGQKIIEESDGYKRSIGKIAEITTERICLVDRRGRERWVTADELSHELLDGRGKGMKLIRSEVHYGQVQDVEIQPKKTISLERQAERREEFSAITTKVKLLIGPLTRSGVIDLSKIPAKNFGEFVAYLQSHAGFDGMSFSNPYQELLDDKGFWPLLELLYIERDKKLDLPFSTVEEAESVLKAFITELIGIDADRFVQTQIGTPEGRALIWSVLEDKWNFDLKTRAAVCKAIPAATKSVVGNSGTYEIRKNFDVIDQYLDYGNWFTTEEQIAPAKDAILHLFQEMDRIEQNLAERRGRIIEKPQEIEGAEKIVEIVKETEGQRDPVGLLKNRLAHLWLFTADVSNWNQGYGPDRLDHSWKDIEKTRAYLRRGAKFFLKNLDRVRSDKDLRKLNKKIHDWLNSSIHLDGWMLKNEFKHQIVGDSIGDFLAKMPSHIRAPFDNLVQYSDRIKSTHENGEEVWFEKRDLRVDEPLREGVGKMIEALHETKLGLWEGYKQHKAFSRAGSRVRKWATGGGNITEIQKATSEIDQLIYKLEHCYSADHIDQTVTEIYEKMKGGGVLHTALLAAEMDGAENLIGLLQTSLEIIIPSLVTGGAVGLARLGALGLRAKQAANLVKMTQAAKAIREGKRYKEAVLRLGRLEEAARAGYPVTAGALRAARASTELEKVSAGARAQRGFGLGAYSSTADNLFELGTGGYRPGGETLEKFVKDALATGTSMAITALARISKSNHRNIMMKLYERFTSDGFSGFARTFAADAGMEAVEEIIDQYVRQFLDGNYDALTWGEIREITTICFVGSVTGALKVGAVAESAGGTIRQNRTIPKTPATPSNNTNPFPHIKSYLDRAERQFLHQKISTELGNETEAMTALLNRPELARTRLGIQIIRKLLPEISLEDRKALLPLLDRAGFNEDGTLKSKEDVRSPRESDEGMVPKIPVTVRQPPGISREGGTATIIFGGVQNHGYSAVIPETGEVVKVPDGGQFRYNTAHRRYEYKTKGSDWVEIIVGQNVATNRYVRYMLLKVSGVLTDRTVDADQDLQQQILFQLATEGVWHHLLQLKRNGKGINETDAQNLSLLFDITLDRAFEAYSSDNGDRTMGGIHGGTSTAYLFVDPVTGKILKICDDTPTPKEIGAEGPQSRELRWSVVENPDDIHRPYWFERNHGFVRPVSLEGVPPGSVAIPITIERMTGRVVIETPRADLEHFGFSKKAVRRMRNLHGAVIRPGNAVTAGLKEYAARRVQDRVEGVDEPAAASPADLGMYTLPGQEPTTQRDLHRYQISNDRLTERLTEQIEKGLADKKAEVRQNAARMIQYAPENDRTRLIEKGLEDQDQFVRKTAIEMIRYAPEGDRGRLIEKGLESREPGLREIAARMIPYAPKGDQPRLGSHLVSLIERGLEKGDLHVRETSVWMIRYAPENDRTRFIEKGLEDREPNVRRDAARMIEYAPESDRTRLIERILEGENYYLWGIAAEMIEHAPKGDQPHLRSRLTPLIERGMEAKDATLRNIAMRMIRYAPESDRTRFVEKGLEDENIHVRNTAAEMIEHAPENDRARLIEKGLEDKDFYVRETAASMIRNAPENDRTRLIEKGFRDSRSFVRNTAVRMIEHAPPNDRARLIEECLKDTDDVRKTATKMITHAPVGEQQRLWRQFHQGKEIDPRQLATETPLYRSTPKHFVRQPFEKSGSGTTLLGTPPGSRSLLGRVILRHIGYHAYATWRRAFEAANFWKERGFDYVPIEPIVSVQPDPKNNLHVAVSTRVLGTNVEHWKENSLLFHAEINAQVQKIREGLSALGIEHGHLHEANFCLVFYRTASGEIDLTRPPRVYVIDFDQSVSKPQAPHRVGGGSGLPVASTPHGQAIFHAIGPKHSLRPDLEKLCEGMEEIGPEEFKKIVKGLNDLVRDRLRQNPTDPLALEQEATLKKIVEKGRELLLEFTPEERLLLNIGSPTPADALKTSKDILAQIDWLLEQRKPLFVRGKRVRFDDPRLETILTKLINALLLQGRLPQRTIDLLLARGFRPDGRRRAEGGTVTGTPGSRVIDYAIRVESWDEDPSTGFELSPEAETVVIGRKAGERHSPIIPAQARLFLDPEGRLHIRDLSKDPQENRSAGSGTYRLARDESEFQMKTKKNGGEEIASVWVEVDPTEPLQQGDVIRLGLDGPAFTLSLEAKPPSEINLSDTEAVGNIKIGPLTVREWSERFDRYFTEKIATETIPYDNGIQTPTDYFANSPKELDETRQDPRVRRNGGWIHYLGAYIYFFAHRIAREVGIPLGSKEADHLMQQAFAFVALRTLQTRLQLGKPISPEMVAKLDEFRAQGIEIPNVRVPRPRQILPVAPLSVFTGLTLFWRAYRSGALREGIRRIDETFRQPTTLDPGTEREGTQLVRWAKELSERARQLGDNSLMAKAETLTEDATERGTARSKLKEDLAELQNAIQEAEREKKRADADWSLSKNAGWNVVGRLATLERDGVITQEMKQEFERYLGIPGFRERIIEMLKKATGKEDGVLIYVSGQKTKTNSVLRSLLFELSRLESVSQSTGISPTLQTQQSPEVSYHDLHGKVRHSRIDSDIPLVDNHIFEAKVNDGEGVGFSEAAKNQALKYQAAVENPESHYLGATIEVSGRLSLEYLRLLEERCPDVELLYALRLPDGHEFSFVLKPAREGRRSFVRTTPATNLTEREQRIVDGIQRRLQDGTAAEILSSLVLTEEDIADSPFASELRGAVVDGHVDHRRIGNSLEVQREFARLSQLKRARLFEESP